MASVCVYEFMFFTEVCDIQDIFRMFLEFAAVLNFAFNFQTLKPKFLFSDSFQFQ